MTDAIVVLTTVEKSEDAERLARLLVEGRVAACVQILPMTSIYSWQDSIERSDEMLLIIKTTRSVYLALERTIKENHPYQVPEIISLPIESGSKDYLSWLKGIVK